MQKGTLSRRGFIGAVSSSAVAASLFDASVAAQVIPSTRTNILYVHSHDSGRFWSPYGVDVPTPHIGAMAREGVTFR
ncbi:hypothetical protein [Novosphingobium sp.]|uniref:hypothetical protein n=1 Tax=Novosphingobium sp. TaxID=1874826 RepID=UPI00286DD7B4|nr:hypothetical protein [Novosphingobium sp.]